MKRHLIYGRYSADEWLGHGLPRWLGIAGHDHCRREILCAVMPLHIVIRLGRRLWELFRWGPLFPSRRSKLLRELAADRDRWRERACELEGRLDAAALKLDEWRAEGKG